MTHKAEMRPAYEWTCDNCGRGQFESARMVESDTETELELAKNMGLVSEFATEIPEEMTGNFVTYPDSVTCEHCGAEFETQHHSEE